MAMIVCRNCGKPVSDKDKKCIYCNEILIPNDSKTFENRNEESVDEAEKSKNSECKSEIKAEAEKENTEKDESTENSEGAETEENAEDVENSEEEKGLENSEGAETEESSENGENSETLETPNNEKDEETAGNTGEGESTEIAEIPNNEENSENPENAEDGESTENDEKGKGRKLSKKIKIIIGVAAAISAAFIIIFISVGQYHRGKSKEYYETLKSATTLMYFGASDAEKCGKLIRDVWYNSIYKESDERTDKYTKYRGYFLPSFNTALRNLYNDSGFISKVESIKTNQNAVNSLMKKLKNPPEEYEDAHEAIIKLHDAYVSLTNCAISPSGSLIKYSSTLNDADNDTYNAYKVMDMYIE
ncbi:MAG: hypothetical protein SOR59_05715 [Lachnospiraceae bacterium]|nr:hypothetical protein [Lachnospiraceae bacterium]